jgi:hypothetical protein
MWINETFRIAGPVLPTRQPGYRVKIRIRRMVRAADISNEPKQPNRLEKKKNIGSVLRSPGDDALVV